MNLQTILTLQLLLIGSFLVKISEAEETLKNSTNECSPAARTKSSAVTGPLCVPYGVDSDIFKNGGYCKDIIGNLPVYGRNKYELRKNEYGMYLYQMVKHFVGQKRGNFSSSPTGEQHINMGGSWAFRQSCSDWYDDIYCHHAFERCYISSRPQPVCREACEELIFNICDREFKMMLEFNLKQQRTGYPFYWDIINCPTLPFRNESTNCYYPNKIREQLNVLESEDCFYGDGRGYRGDVNTTFSSYTCQSWNEQCPHKHNISGAIYKEIRNSSNFCRNPGGFGLNGTWCYTTNRTVQWEYCDVPKCAEQPPSSPPANFRGHNLSSTNIKVFWGDVPKSSVHGVLLGFHVACKKRNSSDRHFADLAPGKHNCLFKGLEKFTNYSCWMRAYNNFGNGTWSEELVISTDEDVPSAPPESLEAWNLSSTSLQVQWGPIPVRECHGKILGYNVEAIPEKQKRGRIRRNPTASYTTSRSLTFSELKKYTKYMISVYGLTRRGKGPPRVLSVQTDEDVPDRSPTDITAFHLGKNAVQLSWSPVAPEYTNGEVLGYKVLYSDVNDTSRVNSTVVSPEETILKIGGLRPDTNYSFHILAFTAKGDGTMSATYFARTLPDLHNGRKQYTKGNATVTGTSIIVMAAVFSGTVALGALAVAIFFIRKRRRSLNFNDGNNLRCAVTPYATSSLNWIERIVANGCHGYETMDDENVPSTSGQPFYINIAPDGSLDLPRYLRDVFFEFEQSYENTNYNRLHLRRRSLGEAVEIHGNSVYDKLQRMISPSLTTAESPNHNDDLGELREVMHAFQGNACTKEMTEIGAVGKAKPRHRRRFSVDLGETQTLGRLLQTRYHREGVQSREGVIWNLSDDDGNENVTKQ